MWSPELCSLQRRWHAPPCRLQNNSTPQSLDASVAVFLPHRDEDGGQVCGCRGVACLADAGQVEGVPQGFVDLERPVQLHLQRVVRAQLDVLVLRQVAPAQPDGLPCQVTNGAALSAPKWVRTWVRSKEAARRPLTSHGLHTRNAAMPWHITPSRRSRRARRLCSQRHRCCSKCERSKRA